MTEQNGTEVTCRDRHTGESESITLIDDHVLITDGRAYVSSITAHANGTQVITVRKAATADEARRYPTKITRHFGKAATR